MNKRINLVGLIKIWVKANNTAKIADRNAPGYDLVYNYIKVESGRVWIMWDDRHYKFTVLKEVVQFLHCYVKSWTWGYEMPTNNCIWFENNITGEETLTTSFNTYLPSSMASERRF